MNEKIYLPLGVILPSEISLEEYERYLTKIRLSIGECCRISYTEDDIAWHEGRVLQYFLNFISEEQELGRNIPRDGIDRASFFDSMLKKAFYESLKDHDLVDSLMAVADEKM